MDAAGSLLERGVRAPDFVLPRSDGTPTRFYAVAGGRPAVVCLFDPAAADQARRVADLTAALRAPGMPELSLHAVVRGQAPPGAGSEVLVDADAGVHTAYRAGDGTATCYVLDPNLRVLDAVALRDVARAIEVVTAAVAGLPHQQPVEVTAQAPALLVPNALDEAFRAELMDVWERQGAVETGVETSAGGQRGEALAAGYKRRRDHTVTDEALSRRIAAAVGRRIMPEIAKAFAYRATRFEGFKIGCYDATTGGFFRPHRDNLSPATAHRRFALTLNLNDDYGGGQLRFPEYGPQRYRPAGGTALIFSCSHLHEVLDVTAGRRFVLLSFLSGDPPPR